MKIVIERGKFQNAINAVKDVVGNDLSILQNIKIETTGDEEVTLTATNLTQTLSATAACQVNEKGVVTVPAKLISQMVGVLTTPMIEFRHDGTGAKAVLMGGETTFKMATIDAKEFPKEARVDGSKVVFTADELKDMIRKSAYAISVDETRRSLMGVCFQFKDGTAAAVATDGRRLGCAKVSKDTAGEFEAIVPAASIRSLQKLIGDGEVTMTVKPKEAVRFSADHWALQTKTVSDTYPNWKQVVPPQIAHSLSIDRSQFIDAVKQVSVASDASNCNIKLHIKQGVMTFTAANADLSDAKAMSPVKYDGEDISINLNPRYVLDALGSLDNDSVFLNINNGHSPITFTSDENEGVAVIMPLRVS